MKPERLGSHIMTAMDEIKGQLYRPDTREGLRLVPYTDQNGVRY